MRSDVERFMQSATDQVDRCSVFGGSVLFAVADAAALQTNWCYGPVGARKTAAEWLEVDCGIPELVPADAGAADL